jgi:hypothetical protein
MKIKRDFVTNSSSTSFILNIESETEDPNKILKIINDFFQDYINKNDWNDDCDLPALLTPDRIVKNGPKKFTIEDYIPYYKDNEDIPEYIKELLSKLKNGKDGQTSVDGDIKSMGFEIINKNE